MTNHDWKIFTGKLEPHDGVEKLPDPPPWRRFSARREEGRLSSGRCSPSYDGSDRGHTFQARPEVVDMVNAALYLRRPLLVTGRPGTGKSSLIYAVAHELRLGPVLRWPVTSRSTLQQALYQYDAIGRLQEAQLNKTTPDIGRYLRLGPLGTALLPSTKPRALLVDEIDKADIDLPSDLLNIFEEGEYRIPELERYAETQVQIQSVDMNESVLIVQGRVQCEEFPFVVLTSNGEREFPAPFLRRCLRLEMPEPEEGLLASIIVAHFGRKLTLEDKELMERFLRRRTRGALATDQLLNAIHFVVNGHVDEQDRDRLIEALFRELTTLDSI